MPFALPLGLVLRYLIRKAVRYLIRKRYLVLRYLSHCTLCAALRYLGTFLPRQNWKFPNQEIPNTNFLIE